MASEAQILANRANAQASTGPKTLEGKEKSRENALRHGIEARVVSALGEDGDAFEQHHLALVHTLAPYNAYEFGLVRRLVQLSWRLERLARMEAAMLDGVAARTARCSRRRRSPSSAAGRRTISGPPTCRWSRATRGSSTTPSGAT